jgi:hypothetical protein
MNGLRTWNVSPGISRDTSGCTSDHLSTSRTTTFGHFGATWTRWRFGLWSDHICLALDILQYCTVLSDHYSKGPAAANTCSKRCVFHRLSHSRSAADNHILYIANGCCYHFTLNQLYCAILLKDVLVRKVRRREEEYGNHGQADSADADKSCYSS